MSKVNENTTMTVGVVVIIVTACIYLALMYSGTTVNAEDIKEIKGKQNQYNKDLERIDARLSRMEGALESCKER